MAVDVRVMPAGCTWEPTAALRELHALECELEQERYSGDPPTPFDVFSNARARRPAEITAVEIAACHGDELVGVADARIRDDHATGRVAVRRAWRGCGVGSKLLEALSAELRSRDVPTLRGTTADPGSAKFCQRAGARSVDEDVALEFSVSPVTMRRVEEESRCGAATFASLKLDAYASPLPNALLESVSGLRRMFNDAPSAAPRPVERETMAELRAREAAYQSGERARTTIVASDVSSGLLVAYSGVDWAPHNPTIAWHGLTAVIPALRGRGVGRWVKATMLVHIVTRWPTVRTVRTTNATVNQAVVAVNERLGFRATGGVTTWELEVQR